MIGNDYYFVGINLRYGYAGSNQNGWSAILDFTDAGFANDDVAGGIVSTEGTLTTRYSLRDSNGVSGAQVALESVLRDAAKLGIKKVSDLNRDRTMDVTLFISSTIDIPYEQVPNEDLMLLKSLASKLGFNVIANEK